MMFTEAENLGTMPSREKIQTVRDSEQLRVRVGSVKKAGVTQRSKDAVREVGFWTSSFTASASSVAC